MIEILTNNLRSIYMYECTWTPPIRDVRPRVDNEEIHDFLVGIRVVVAPLLHNLDIAREHSMSAAGCAGVSNARLQLQPNVSCRRRTRRLVTTLHLERCRFREDVMSFMQVDLPTRCSADVITHDRVLQKNS